MVLLSAGAFYQAVTSWHKRKTVNPLGQMVHLGSHKLHFYLKGSGNTTIIFESGLGGSFLQWMNIQNKLAKSAQTISYDRAGMGFSTLGPFPRTSRRVAFELDQSLTKLNITNPLILVGHSFGGLFMRHFYEYRKEQVKGIVFVDSVNLQQPSLKRQIRKTFQRFFEYNFIFWGMARLAIRLDVDFIKDALFLDLPEKYRDLHEMLRLQNKTFRTIFSESIQEKYNKEMIEKYGNLGDLPIKVISGYKIPNPAIKEYHQKIADWSTNSEHILATNSKQYIHLEQPEVVINAIKALL